MKKEWQKTLERLGGTVRRNYYEKWRNKRWAFRVCLPTPCGAGINYFDTEEQMAVFLTRVEKDRKMMAEIMAERQSARPE